MSMFTPGGPSQTLLPTKGSVLATATEVPFDLLPAPVAQAATALGTVVPASSTDWFRLLLFVVLGISFVLGIRYTLRDLAH
jgi:hypothetical protein